MSATKRDRYGRYLIVPAGGGKPVPHTRATTWASTCDNRYALEKWSRRTVALGLARRPDLLASVAAANDDDRTTLDALCERALEAGGSSTSAWLTPASVRMIRARPVRASRRTSARSAAVFGIDQ